MENTNEKFYESIGVFLKLSRFIKFYDWRRKIDKLVLRLVEKSILGGVTERNKILLVLEIVLGLARDIGCVTEDQFLELKNALVNMKSLINKDVDDKNTLVDVNDLNDANDSDINVLNVLDSRSKIGNNLKSLGEIMDKKISNFKFPVFLGKKAIYNSDPNNNDVSIRHSAIIRQTQDSSIASRHGAIIDSIRQLGNCRMKDLMANFTNISERTLRNDLQKMCEMGVIRRVGNGGPHTFYTDKM